MPTKLTCVKAPVGNLSNDVFTYRSASLFTSCSAIFARTKQNFDTASAFGNSFSTPLDPSTQETFPASVPKFPPSFPSSVRMQSSLSSFTAEPSVSYTHGTEEGIGISPCAASFCKKNGNVTRMGCTDIDTDGFACTSPSVAL